MVESELPTQLGTDPWLGPTPNTQEHFRIHSLLWHIIADDMGIPLGCLLVLSGWGEVFKNGHIADAQTLGTTYSSA
jgi:hypothetical protein